MAGSALTFFKGQWLEGNPGIIGPMNHCMWLSSVVFDGARAFEGVAPALSQRLSEVISALKGKDLAVVISQSDLNHSQSLFDREYIIERGANGTMREKAH